MASKYEVNSVRMSQDARRKLDEIRIIWGSDGKPMDTGQAMDMIMTIVGKYQLSADLPERQTDIEDFNHHLWALSDAYAHSLRLNKNAEGRIWDRFQRQFDEKNSLVNTLQKNLQVAEEERDKAREEAENLRVQVETQADQINALKNRVTELEADKAGQEALASVAEHIQAMLAQTMISKPEDSQKGVCRKD